MRLLLARVCEWRGDMTTVSARAVTDLFHHDANVREDAARRLGNGRSDDSYAVPDLICALDDPYAAVRKHAARALGRICPDFEAAVSALSRRVKSEPLNDVWRSVVFALRQIGRYPEDAVRPMHSDKSVHLAM
jgi:HEAT repeat protein